MSKIYINTDKLDEASELIKNHTAKLEQLLVNYVIRMQKVLTDTKEWQGNAAENFVQTVKNDYKTDQVPMLNSIRKYAQELQFISNDYKKVVKENEL
jgi:uncharacterized protein YukE